MLFLQHRNNFSGVSVGSFRDRKLGFANKCLTTPPMLSHGFFSYDVMKKSAQKISKIFIVLIIVS